VGDAYYYLTFAGGTNVGNGAPNGAGVLGKMTFDSIGQPVFSKVVDLPGRFVAFPGGDVCPDGTNALYFTTTGVSTNPGAIVKFDLLTSQLTTLFTFLSNSVPATNYGKVPGYCTPVLYEKELYFTTLNGGISNKGVVAKLTLSDNSVTKLADLEGTAGQALGGSPQYHGGTLYTNPFTGRICIYFPIRQGGTNAPSGLANGCGTILRVDMQPPPIQTSISMPDPSSVTLTWTGGYQPFSIVTNGSLATPVAGWPAATNGITSPTGSGPWSVTLPTSGDTTYYLVTGQSQ
jgi:hypothetical protein